MSQPPPLPWSAQTQPERVILLTFWAVAVMAGFLLLPVLAGFRLWGCVWKTCTGLPCAGCGGTRSVVLMLSGEWSDALLMNPGAVVGILALLFAAIYSATVLLLRLPPWRPAWFAGRGWQLAMVAALVLNWCYLLWGGRV